MTQTTAPASAGADSPDATAVSLYDARSAPPTPVGSAGALLDSHKQVVALIGSVLERDRDYGVIPGTDRPALLKPGAERLAIAVGASVRYEILEREIDHDREMQWRKVRAKWSGPKGRRRKVGEEVIEGTALGVYRYVIRATLVRKADSVVLGEGIGACSTLESKYCDRPRELENTILKMAKKRAAVDAVCSALGLSDRFASDDDSRAGAPDRDGVVQDPTDGLTLSEAKRMSVRKQPLGEMDAERLEEVLAWARAKAHAEQDPRMTRLAAAVELVQRDQALQARQDAVDATVVDEAVAAEAA